MVTPIQLTPDTLASLYGDAFYIFPGDTIVAPEVQVATPTQPVAQPERPVAVAEPVQPQVTQNPEAAPSKPGITWRPKPSSRVLFVLQLAEFKNSELTELLKKIVDSLEIDPALVGFGQIDGPVDLAEFDTMPNPHAIVFDQGIWGGAENPVRLGKGEVYFSHPLAILQHDQNLKRLLWGHLKALKEKLV